ncbi:MAG: hypothetical protein ABI164_08600, partial [Acidobacteriaceae bacterium]
MKIRCVSLLAGSLLCLATLWTATPALAETPWTEVRSPHFRVLTNGSSADGRHVAHEFEQMRYVFATRFPNFRLDSGAPLTIFAARDEATAKMLVPTMWKSKGARPGGLFHHGWEKQYVMVRLDMPSEYARNVVYHEYTHSILHLNSRWLPVWLDEGLAEFYGYTRFEQHKIEIGAPTIRVRSLQSTPIPIEDLMSSDKVRSYYRDEDRAEMFYAESWALVHYLIFGPGMDLGTKLNQFFQLIQGDTGQKAAFVQVFGSFAAMDKALDAYMRNVAFHAAVMQDPPQINEKDFVVTKLTMGQTHAELAGFHLWNGDRPDARPLVDKALKDDPSLGLPFEEKGFLLFADGEDATASVAFSHACSLDKTLYLALFAKTMLSPAATSSTPAEMAAFHDALHTVVELNPQFAPAYVQLARLAVRQGNLPLAFGLSRHAEQLEPSRAGYHLLTAQLLLRMGKDAQAADFARYVANHWYATDREEAVELWNRIPAASRPAGPNLTVQIPGNTQTADGTVTATTCYGKNPQRQLQPWTMILDQNGKQLTFHSKGRFAFGFADTLWWGE